jgi:putative ABC transport system ATP-binding protein
MSATPSQNGSVISAVALTKTYQRGREEVRALGGVTFKVSRGEFVAIVGPSGAGKSTLLNIIGCMDVPTSGTVELGGRPVHSLTEQARTRLRRDELGFVFQHFGLLPTLTVAENISLPVLFARRGFWGGRRGEERVTALLEKIGLNHRRDHRPGELSGGEMQRVAVARALINQPRLLLADEPTGNLDSKTGESIITLFKQLHREGLTIIVVTHNPALAAAAQRQIELRDGVIATA